MVYNYLNQDCKSFFSTNNDSKILSLPISEHLTNDHLKYVTEKIKKFYND